MSQNGISRRQVLAGLGGVMAGGTGIYLTSGTSEGAQVRIDGFNLERTEYVTDGKEITDALLTVDAQYQYEANIVPTKWTLELLVSRHGDDYVVIDETEQTELSSKTDNGTVELEGSILDTYHYDSTIFAPPEGSMRETTLTAKLRFTLYDGEEILKQSSVEDDAGLQITNETIEATVNLGGNGSVKMQH